MKYIFAFFILIFSFQEISSQNYKIIDSIVANYPDKFKSIEQFANRIKKDFKTDLEITRAVYYWISNNISYDYKSYNKGINSYNTIKISYKASQKDVFALEKKYAEKVLKQNTGVCEGYSQLLKFTLLKLNVEAYVIHGYSKTNISEIGRIRNETNHAWNGVNIDGNWKLIDATWSTGNTEKEPKSFNFKDIYFFINPENMILNHLPKYPNWQLLDKPISKKDFFSQPVIYNNYFNSNLLLKKNTNGVIKVKQGNTINLSFKSADINKFYSYEFKEDNYSTKFIFEKTKDGYVVKIPFPYKRNSTLTIFDSFSILDFKIILER